MADFRLLPLQMSDYQKLQEETAAIVSRQRQQVESNGAGPADSDQIDSDTACETLERAPAFPHPQLDAICFANSVMHARNRIMLLPITLLHATTCATLLSHNHSQSAGLTVGLTAALVEELEVMLSELDEAAAREEASKFRADEAESRVASLSAQLLTVQVSYQNKRTL